MKKSAVISIIILVLLIIGGSAYLIFSNYKIKEARINEYNLLNCWSKCPLVTVSSSINSTMLIMEPECERLCDKVITSPLQDKYLSEEYIYCNKVWQENYNFTKMQSCWKDALQKLAIKYPYVIK